MIFIAGCSLGKITAKIMRDAKEAKKMGEAGVGAETGGDVTVEGSEFDLAGPQSESRAGPVSFAGPVDISGPGGGSMMGGPGITAPGPAPEGTVSPAGGTAAVELPTPRAWEAAIESATVKGKEEPAISRKKRRRSLLTEEEGGVLGTAPIYRRSILGR